MPVSKHLVISNISGGLFAGLPDKVERSWILTDDDLKYLVEMYSKTGFRLVSFSETEGQLVGVKE